MNTPVLAKHIDHWPVDALVPYSRNARTHSAAQIDQLVRSIQTFGFTNPILVDGAKGILAGHGRLKAAVKAGLERVPVIVLDHLTEAERRAYILADNKLAENAGWDDELLAAELREIQAMDFDLSIVGFDEGELTKLIDGDEQEISEGPEPQFDRAAALMRKWGTSRGQVWEFGGGHHVMCGDAMDAGDVARLMGDRSAALCFTSPPYANQRMYRSGGVGDWDELMNGVFSQVRMAHAGQILVNLGLVHNDGEWLNYWDRWLEWMRSQGWRRFGLYVWHQGPGLPGDWNGRFAPSHELLFHFNREARQPNKILDCAHAGEDRAHGTGMRLADGSMSGYTHAGRPIQPMKIPDSVVDVMRHKGRQVEIIHPAVFPVALPAFMMRSWTDEGELCYEPFAGAGTQFIAAEQLKRVCYGMEIAPEYCAVILERMSEMGLKPELLPLNAA